MFVYTILVGLRCRARMTRTCPPVKENWAVLPLSASSKSLGPHGPHTDEKKKGNTFKTMQFVMKTTCFLKLFGSHYPTIFYYL